MYIPDKPVLTDYDLTVSCLEAILDAHDVPFEVRRKLEAHLLIENDRIKEGQGSRHLFMWGDRPFYVTLEGGCHLRIVTYGKDQHVHVTFTLIGKYGDSLGLNLLHVSNRDIYCWECYREYLWNKMRSLINWTEFEFSANGVDICPTVFKYKEIDNA